MRQKADNTMTTKRTNKRNRAIIGGISRGTMRPQDLIPRFCDQLRWLGMRNKALSAIESRYNRAINGKYGENDKYFTDEVSAFDLDELFDLLNEFAPPYCYFGAHPGDGSDYGFWITEFLEDDFDGLKVDDTSEIPANYTGDVLHVNDHGNMTLYSCTRGKRREVWAVV
jgi:hypothetical protein